MNIYVLVLIILFAFIACNQNQVKQVSINNSTPKPTTEFGGNDFDQKISDITQNRVLSQYEKGGEFDCKTDVAKVRDFVWLLWTEKKRGYIKMDCDGKDSFNTKYYFIEPNEKNEWHILVREFYEHSIPEYSKPVKDSIAVYAERVEENNNWWQLILKSEKNEIVDKLPFY